MTPEQKMQKVVETAGGCWHDVTEKDGVVIVLNQPGSALSICHKCKDKVNVDRKPYGNPSPTDLNELFRLADKLGAGDIISSSEGGCTIVGINGIISGTGDNRAEALLNALYEAIDNGRK
jgi:hypothetical protein